MESPQNDRAQRPIADILTDLAKPVPQRHVQQKRQGGARIDFVTWYRTQMILDHYTRGYWSQDTYITMSDGYAVARCSITVHGADKTLTRTATGSEALAEHVKGKAYGDPTSNAEAQAFKRACARFGLALHLYDKD